MIQAGKFNCQITIEASTVQKGAAGGKAKVWALFSPKVWATRSSRSGNEKPATAAAGGVVAAAREEFLLYRRSHVTPSMRVVCGGRFYNIVHVNDTVRIGNRPALILTCDTGVNDG